MESNARTTSSTARAQIQDDRSAADRAAFAAASYVRTPRIPTAVPAPVTVTREQVAAQLAATR